MLARDVALLHGDLQESIARILTRLEVSGVVAAAASSRFHALVDAWTTLRETSAELSQALVSLSRVLDGVAGDSDEASTVATDLVQWGLSAIGGGVLGNVGYDMLKTMVRIRGVERVAQDTDLGGQTAVLAKLALQARCAELDLRIPSSDELHVASSEELTGRTRVVLRAEDGSSAEVSIAHGGGPVQVLIRGPEGGTLFRRSTS